MSLEEFTQKNNGDNAVLFGPNKKNRFWRQQSRPISAICVSGIKELPASSSNTYQYNITITTGIWWNAGTTAKVAMEIYGTENSTGIICLNTDEDGNDSLFYRGGLDVFRFTIDKSLGCVRGVRIGHDNSGSSPSWFLQEVTVLDVQTLNSWTFHNNQWLALERGDGRIERVLDNSSDDADLNSEVWKWWTKGLTEKHAWVSVLAKHSRDRFSRSQRASCCLSILMSAMLANALFYDDNKKSSSIFIQVGPLKFSWREVMVGIQSALIVAPVNILIAFLFEKGSLRTSDQQNQASNLRRWFINVAWILCLCATSISATLTIFYSLYWGKNISEQWLSSMTLSVVLDVTIMEPTKVFIVAVFQAIVRRIKRRVKVGSVSIKEKHQVSTKGRLWKIDLSTVEEMRRRQARKQNVSRFFVELVVYALFIIVLTIVCYGDRNGHRYFMTKSIREGLPRFQKVSNNQLYWRWMRYVFVPGIYAGAWYNGLQENESIYIGDQCSALVGMPRITQLRVKPNPCEVVDYMKTTFHTCHYAYSKENEDTTSYNKPGWLPVDNSTKKHELNRLCPKPWRYQTPVETNTVTKWGHLSSYPGGGFVADLGYKRSTSLQIIDTLQTYGWLDLQSRPVILEFSAFNPATNLLVIVNHFYETHTSGYKESFESIDTISLYSEETGSHQFYLLCKLIFIVFMLFFVGKLSYTVYKQQLSFLRSFWNWVDVFEVVFSVLAVVMNIIRSSKAVETIRKMKANIYANVNFQDVIVLSDIENAVLGTLMFLVTLKLLRLIRYNKNVGIFSRTLKMYSKILPSFFLVFAIGFVAFMHFGILVFGTGFERYSSPLKASYFQLELILGKVKARPINQLTEVNRSFGRIFSAFILLTLTIFLMNIFIVTLNDSLVDAKKSVIHSGLYQVIDEESPNNEEKNKKFFDDISKGLKERSKKEKRLVGNSDNSVCENFSSKATGLSRKNGRHDSSSKDTSGRQRSFYDKLSVHLKQLKRNPVQKTHRKSQKKRWEEHCDNRTSIIPTTNAKKASRKITRLKPPLTKAKGKRRILFDRVSIALKQMRGTPFTERERKLQLKKLNRREEILSELLDRIMQVENAEERQAKYVENRAILSLYKTI